ncbi:MAG: chloramphenicol acetyltransferase [Clostridia bacterium]|nr:chloramphenicol acetyltransferase [Clostridia bacterium]
MKRLDMAQFARRAHFQHFFGMAYPYVGVTVETEVTPLLALCRERGYSFYLMMLHAVALAADEIPELRQRIDNGGVVEYEACPTSHTELKADGTYAYCTLHHHLPLQEYLARAEAARKAARESGSIEEEAEVQSMYFISTLPWLHYTALIQPVCCGEESNPRFTWGKYQTNDQGRVTIPLSVLAHHALADGVHIAAFYEAFDRVMTRLCEEE